MPDLKRFDLRTRDLSAEEEREVARLLEGGALVVYPTDTLYAIGCRALDGEAVAELRRAKGREAAKALPVIVADVFQARSISASWPEAAGRLAAAFWPGPLTLVVPAAPGLPDALLAGGSSVAVRVPASPIARALARLGGPLISTSANLASEAPCVTVDEALMAFPQATLAVDIGPLDGEPSTIVDATEPGGNVRLIRQGKISAGAVEAALGGRVYPG